MAAKAPTPAALAQVRLDAARVLARVQTTLIFQVATALQLALNALLAPAEEGCSGGPGCPRTALTLASSRRAVPRRCRTT